MFLNPSIFLFRMSGTGKTDELKAVLCKNSLIVQTQKTYFMYYIQFTVLQSVAESLEVYITCWLSWRELYFFAKDKILLKYSNAQNWLLDDCSFNYEPVFIGTYFS